MFEMILRRLKGENFAFYDQQERLHFEREFNQKSLAGHALYHL